MNPKILVVDDEDNMLTLLARVLGKEGYQVTGVPTGEEALILAGRKTFDLAIVDVLMPQMDGLTVLRKLKEIDPALPVILVTAFPSWEKEKEARAAGCLDFLSKPLDLREIKKPDQEKYKNYSVEEEGYACFNRICRGTQVNLAGGARLQAHFTDYRLWAVHPGRPGPRPPEPAGPGDQEGAAGIQAGPGDGNHLGDG